MDVLLMSGYGTGCIRGLFRQATAKNLPEFSKFRPDDKTAIRRIPVVGVVILVVILRFVKGGERADFGYDFLRPGPAGIQLLPVMLRQPFLLLRVIKDDRTVLSPCIGPLSVQACRIVCFPEHLQQLCVADNGGIVNNTGNFSVPAVSFTDFFIGRVGQAAAGIPRFNVHNSFDLLKHCFGAPEAPCTECGGSCCCGFHTFFVLLKPVAVTEQAVPVNTGSTAPGPYAVVSPVPLHKQPGEPGVQFRKGKEADSTKPGFRMASEGGGVRGSIGLIGLPDNGKMPEQAVVGVVKAGDGDFNVDLAAIGDFLNNTALPYAGCIQ